MWHFSCSSSLNEIFMCDHSVFSEFIMLLIIALFRNVLKCQVALQQCFCQKHRTDDIGVVSDQLLLAPRHVTFSVIGTVVKIILLETHQIAVIVHQWYEFWILSGILDLEISCLWLELFSFFQKNMFPFFFYNEEPNQYNWLGFKGNANKYWNEYLNLSSSLGDLRGMCSVTCVPHRSSCFSEMHWRCI